MTETMTITRNGATLEVVHEGPTVTKVTIEAVNGGGLTEWPVPDLTSVIGLIGTSNGNGTKRAATKVAKAPPVKATAPAKAATAKTPAKATKTTKATKVKSVEAKPAESDPTERRPYRRLTDELAKEVMSTFAQVRSITAVAEHFKVPRHTAQNWIDRLRREGQIPAAA